MGHLSRVLTAGWWAILSTQAVAQSAERAAVNNAIFEPGRGRLQVQFGESAIFQVSHTTHSLSVRVQAETTAAKGADIHSVETPKECTTSYQESKLTVVFQCRQHTLKNIYSYTMTQPRRLVVDYVIEAAPRVAGSGKQTPKNGGVSMPSKIAQVYLRNPGQELPKVFNLAEDQKRLAKEIQEQTVELFIGRDLTPSEVFRVRNHSFFHFATLRERVHFDYKLPEFPTINRTDRLSELYNLTLKLFREKRYALALKTINFIRQISPTHPIWEHLSFLEAETNFRLADAIDASKYYQEGIVLYKAAISIYPQSIYTDAAITHVGKVQLEREEFFGAIDTFISSLGRTSSPASYRIQWKLGVAEALLGQNRFEDALRLYRELAEQTVDNQRRLDGLYRMGDVFMAQGSLPEAIQAYKQAIELEEQKAGTVGSLLVAYSADGPPSLKEYPSVIFNLAEALFWTDQFKESLKFYRHFVRAFPLHENRALAYARTGEILGIFGAPWSLVQGAYLEAMFRHPESLGADISQMRLAAEDLVGGHQDEVRRAKEVFKALFEKYKRNEAMVDFQILLQGEVENRKREYLRAFARVENEYLLRPHRPYQKDFKRSIYENFAFTFRELRRNEQCPKLLGLASEKRNLWFSTENPYFEPYIDMALCQLMMRIPENALHSLDRYEQAIALAKKNTSLWRQVSEIQTILPEYELRYLRAVSYLLLDRPEQASQLLEEMLGDKNVPTLVQDSARMHLVLAYFALANHDKAAQVLSKITDRSVMNYFPFELFREITTLKRYDRYEIAIAVLDDLLRSLTTPAMQMPIWMAKAEMYWANGQWDRASEIYGGIVSLPTDQFIVDRASDKKLELEPLDDGIENGEDRIKGLLSALRSHLRPDEDAAGIQAMSAYRIGLTHSRNRKTSEALKSFEIAKTLAPSSTWAIAAQSEINTIRFNQTYGESLRKQVGRQPTSEQGGLR